MLHRPRTQQLGTHDASNTYIYTATPPALLPAGEDGPTPAYWGYTVPAYLLSLMARVLHLGKLVVVLDLDETLLLAHTKDTVEQRRAAVQSNM